MAKPLHTSQAAEDGWPENAATLEREFAWFTRVLDTRLRLHVAQDCQFSSIDDLEPPTLKSDASHYGDFLEQHRLGRDERLLLMLALAPHLRPQALDPFLVINDTYNRPFTEFGGRVGKAHSGFLPSRETVLFLLAGNDLARRIAIQELLDPSHVLFNEGMLYFEHRIDGEPAPSETLTASHDLLSLLATGQAQKPNLSASFPAKLVTSNLTWADLVLDDEARSEVDTISGWLAHETTVLEDWGFKRILQPGYRALFYGPPGTGKTLTASLIGASAGLDVYRIDLSMMISKYIGETEKNLANLFDQARNKRWILFFDEADALFGKRTQTTSSNDRYANQEVSYLLQRVEDFPGLVILATNLKTNIDQAFARRFQSLVYFPMPEAEQRLRLWRGMFAAPERLAADVDLETLARCFELSGGAITNVVRFAAIRARCTNQTHIAQDDLLLGINKEFLKEGKTVGSIS